MAKREYCDGGCGKFLPEVSETGWRDVTVRDRDSAQSVHFAFCDDCWNKRLGSLPELKGEPVT